MKGILAADQIYKAYTTPVLKDISFSAERGQIVGIAGANGSGKSTLLSILAAIRKPDRGIVTIDGESIHKSPFRKKIGFVPQDISLFENLSALDNIKFWAAANHVDYKTIVFDKADYKKKVKHLSGGVQKRLSIAVSLHHNPDYILMDEPTASLDIVFKQELAYKMAEWKSQGKAVLFTSHQPDELILSDKLYVLKAGKFVFEGSPALLPCEGSSFRERLYMLLTGTQSCV